MMTYALLIDAERAEVRRFELPAEGGNSAQIAALHAAIGGYLELAHAWPSGDVLYCDEDYHQHAKPFGFLFLPNGTQILGNAVVVGREQEFDDIPGGWRQLDPEITAERLAGLVLFFRVEERPRCSICGGTIGRFGNNAWPINEGRCCDGCNAEVVIPARMKEPPGSPETAP